MKSFLLKLPRYQKVIITMLSDGATGFLIWFVFGVPMATYLSSNMQLSLLSLTYNQFYSFLISIFLAIITLYSLGFYKSINRFKSSGEGFFKAFAGSFVFGIVNIYLFVSQQIDLEKNLFFIFIIQGLLLSSIFLAGILFTREFAKYLLGSESKENNATPLLIYGAGAIGTELFKTIEFDKSRRVVAFYDDNQDLHGTTKFGTPIISKEKSLRRFKKIYPDLQIYLAIPSLTSYQRRIIIEKLETLGLSVRSVPAFHEIISDNAALANLQALSLEDLLPSGRIEHLSFDYLNEKCVFVSGAGGSIGSELVRQILINKPKRLILFEQAEFNLYQVLEECKRVIFEKNLPTELVSILGDVKDFNQLQRTFKRNMVDIIFHAAAYKHVPLVEMQENIIPGVANNIIGTFNLCKVASVSNIERFVLISTDKAVRPTNVMGATKRMAELVCQGFAEKYPEIIYSMVRFGNVINSSGSVIPMFREQIKNGGPLTITHKKITRYFMTIPEAASLVICAGINAVGGEVFLLDMGKQLKVYDIAKKMIRLSGRNVSKEPGDGGIEIIDIGLRPGEKMYEELLIEGTEEQTEHPKIFKSKEASIGFHKMQSIIQEIRTSIESDNNKYLQSILMSVVDGYNF